MNSESFMFGVIFTLIGTLLLGFYMNPHENISQSAEEKMYRPIIRIDQASFYNHVDGFILTLLVLAITACVFCYKKENTGNTTNQVALANQFLTPRAPLTIETLVDSFNLLDITGTELDTPGGVMDSGRGRSITSLNSNPTSLSFALISEKGAETKYQNIHCQCTEGHAAPYLKLFALSGGGKKRISE